MNRLKQYLGSEEPQRPEGEGDYWVVETRTTYWIVSYETARVVERTLNRLWRPRWIAFYDVSGGRRAVPVATIEAVFESTAAQRAQRRAFERGLQREAQAERRPWEEDN